MPARNRRSAHRAALALAAIAIVLGAAGTAIAHTERESTRPAAGARVTTPPRAIVVGYSEPVAAVVESSVALDGAPLGGLARASLAPDDAATVRIPLPADVGPGRVSARWVIRSDDGHLIEGTTSFTVAGASLDASIARVATALGAAVRAMRSISA